MDRILGALMAVFLFLSSFVVLAQGQNNATMNSAPIPYVACEYLLERTEIWFVSSAKEEMGSLSQRLMDSYARENGQDFLKLKCDLYPELAKIFDKLFRKYNN